MGKVRLAVVTATLICLSVCASAEAREIRGATARFPDYLDPQLAYSQEGWMALYNTYVPLLTYRHAEGTAGGRVMPGLAKGLPRISDHGYTYTLSLRPGLRYSNGRPVRASDFKFAIERLFKLESGGSWWFSEIAGGLKFWSTKRGGISGIETNDRTGKIVIHLDEPRANFSSLLALPWAAPVPRGTPLRNLTADPPPATGPYVISSSSRGKRWTYARNPVWSHNARLMPQLPGGHADRISVRVIKDASARAEMVEDGRLDWTLGPFGPDLYTELEQEFGAERFRSEPILDTFYFWMNTQQAPFSDLRVRQAVNYALDRNVLCRIFNNEMKPTQQILPRGMPGYRRIEPYPLDLAKARRLIAEAKPKDRDITVWTSNESAQRKASAYYRDVLEELGFTAHLKVIKAANYFAATGKTSTPDLDTGWSNWFADFPHPDDFFEPLLASWSIFPTENENLAQFNFPPFDEVLFTLDETSVPIPEAAYAALDRGTMALAPWAPVCNETVPIFASSSLPLETVIWNPSFAVDLTSLRLRASPASSSTPGSYGTAPLAGPGRAAARSGR